MRDGAPDAHARQRSCGFARVLARQSLPHDYKFRQESPITGSKPEIDGSRLPKLEKDQVADQEPCQEPANLGSIS